MTKSTFMLTISLLLPSIVFASDVPELSDEDMRHVVSAVITLKTNCVTNKLSDCKAADAVMKMFRLNIKDANSEQKDHYMKKYGSLFLESFADGYMNSIAAGSNKVNAQGCPGDYIKTNNEECTLSSKITAKE